MAELRLSGASLRFLRGALSVPPVARLVWKAVSADFHVPDLHRLGPEHLRPIDPAPHPVQGRPPRAWHDAGWDPPAVSGGRTAGRVFRAAYAEGRRSPVEVVEAILAAHEASARSPFIAVDADRARASAEASAARWRAGTPKGPLDGLPIPVKDEFHLRGLPTRGGAKYLERPVDEDAWVVRRLEAAGAIVVGKTHATEWGLNPCGLIEHFTAPRNPYDETRGAGGSSTGSGVATALGWCPSAVGTDGGGSIRIPASLNGVFGLKPTYIRVGRTGDQWGASTVAHIGPIGQTVADLVDQLEATAGIDPDDPLTRWAPDGHDAGPWRKALGRGVKGARIGLLREDLADADPAVAAAVEAAVAALEAEGAEIVDVRAPMGGVVNGIGALTIGCETAGNLRDAFARHGADFGAELAVILRFMALVPASDFFLAARARAYLRRATADLFQDVDLLAMPTSARPAVPYPPSEDRTPVMDSGGTAAMTRFSFLANLTGLPAGTVPIGLVDGLPIGLQLVGDAWDEASVLAAMAHCERLGLHDAVPRPPGWRDLLA